MRVSVVGVKWHVDCRPCGDQKEDWEAPESGWAVLRIGSAYESSSRYFSYLVSDGNTGEIVVELRAATTVHGFRPFLLCGEDRLVLLVEEWVASFDPRVKSLLWERLEDSVNVSAWFSSFGHLLLLQETQVIRIDDSGHTQWARTIPLVSEHRREPPKLFITCFEGERLIIDERTGELLSGP